MAMTHLRMARKATISSGLVMVSPSSYYLVRYLHRPILRRNTEGICHVKVYVSYLVFQLWSHASLYDDKHESNFKSTRHDQNVRAGGNRLRRRLHLGSHASQKDAQVASEKAKGDEKPPAPERAMSNGSLRVPNGTSHDYASGDLNGDANYEGTSAANPSTAQGGAAGLEEGKVEEEEEETPSMSLAMCIGLLVVVTVVSRFLPHHPCFVADSSCPTCSSARLLRIS